MLLWHTCARAGVPGQQPNIVFFYVDDMGWQDTSEPFHDQITELNRRYRTPNMERLADPGLKFTQAYACAVCSPSRVSRMTGLNSGVPMPLDKTTGKPVEYPADLPRT
ncbi:MAG: sulfatase-like hydrolase/transferase [Phycisphaerae bacterium]|nr:sulfatase-like hydrolase/transferase [Phycisphaerae bacterium]